MASYQLLRHWMNELHAPDILPEQEMLLGRILDLVRKQVSPSSGFVVVSGEEGGICGWYRALGTNGLLDGLQVHVWVKSLCTLRWLLRLPSICVIPPSSCRREHTFTPTSLNDIRGDINCTC